MSVNTLDELTPDKYVLAEKAIKKFRKSKKTRNNELELYDSLTNAGPSSESADEYVNLETQE